MKWTQVEILLVPYATWHSVYTSMRRTNTSTEALLWSVDLTKDSCFWWPPLTWARLISPQFYRVPRQVVGHLLFTFQLCQRHCPPLIFTKLKQRKIKLELNNLIMRSIFIHFLRPSLAANKCTCKNWTICVCAYYVARGSTHPSSYTSEIP